MAVWAFEHSVITAAARPDVWRYWTDLSNHAPPREWVAWPRIWIAWPKGRESE
jgi:hypothetical protein